MRALIAALAVLAAAGPALAQNVPAREYRAVDRAEALQTQRFLRIEGRQRGVPSYFFATTENPNMPTGFRVEDVYAYGPWQVCEGWRFSGDCKVIEGKYLRTQAFGLSRIGSARPVA